MKERVFSYLLLYFLGLEGYPAHRRQYLPNKTIIIVLNNMYLKTTLFFLCLEEEAESIVDSCLMHRFSPLSES